MLRRVFDTSTGEAFPMRAPISATRTEDELSAYDRDVRQSVEDHWGSLESALGSLRDEFLAMKQTARVAILASDEPARDEVVGIRGLLR